MIGFRMHGNVVRKSTGLFVRQQYQEDDSNAFKYSLNLGADPLNFRGLH